MFLFSTKISWAQGESTDALDEQKNVNDIPARMYLHDIYIYRAGTHITYILHYITYIRHIKNISSFKDEVHILHTYILHYVHKTY